MFTGWGDTPRGYSVLLNNGSLNYRDDKGSLIAQGYNANDTVYSIVRRIAQNVARSPEGVYRIVDEKRYKEYKLLQKKEPEKLTISDYNFLQTKSIEIDERHPLTKVISEPNANMSQTEYMELRSTYKLLTGDVFEYVRYLGNTPLFFDLLPSPKMVIKTDKGFPVGITGYTLDLGATKRDFEIKEIIQTSYPNPNWTEDGYHLYGQSPLRAGLLSLMTDTEAKRTMAELLKNRGARAMLFIDNPNVDSDSVAQEATDRVRQKFKDLGQEYRNDVIVSFGKAQLVNFGFTPDELKIVDNNRITLQQLCNIFNVPTAMFNNDSQTTRDNVRTYQKDFILNAVLPEKISTVDSFRRHAMRYMGVNPQTHTVEFDYSVYTELEADRVSMWQWLADAPFTENEKRVFMGEQRIEDALMDKIYISKNKIPLELAGKQDNGRKETNQEGDGEDTEDEGESN